MSKHWVGASAGLAACAVVAAAGPAAAAVVIDQSSLVGDGLAFRSSAYHAFMPGAAAGPWGQAQSFTVGVGGRLEALSVDLINQGAAPFAVTLRLYAGVPRRLSDPALYETTWQAQPFRVMGKPYVAWSSLPTLDLSGADLMVTPGQVLTFALTSTVMTWDVGPLSAANGANFTYAGGNKYGVGNGGAILPVFPTGNDLAFRTFVETRPAVPEPATWAVLLLGFGGMGVVLRRARRGATRPAAIAASQPDGSRGRAAG